MQRRWRDIGSDVESTVRVYLAGRVFVEAGERLVTESDFPCRQGRLLFVVLAADHRRAIPHEELAGLVWGEELPAAWETALRALVSKLRAQLRTTLGPDAIESAFGCYQLHIPAGTWVDLEAAAEGIHLAETLVRDGRPGDAAWWAIPAGAIAGRAFLAGHDGDWIEERREKLRTIHVRALCCLAEIWTTVGDTTLAVRDAKQAVQLDPFGERTHRLLMRAHAAAGNRAAALKAYERCRELLAEELGADPSRETQALHLDILRAG